MTIKLVIFDLDGVLIDSRQWHYQALNLALREQSETFVISKEEHAAKFEGLPTSAKLSLLTETKSLPIPLYNTIWRRKQELTVDIIRQSVQPSEKLIRLMTWLRDEKKCRLRCASNAVRDTVVMSLKQLGIFDFFEKVHSNEEIKLPLCKPHPAIYMKAVYEAEVSPTETLVCEDSFVGRTAALQAGCHLCPVETCEDVTQELLERYLSFAGQKVDEPLPWIMTPDMRVCIPMAGAGSRFAKEGFKDIKPLIDVTDNKTMIEVVIRNINIRAHHVFLVQQQHLNTYHLQKWLPRMVAPSPCSLVPVEGLTQGAACTVLLAEDAINVEEPLLIVNSDQFVEWNVHAFMYKMTHSEADGGILTFKCENDPKWSYAELDSVGFVKQVHEKIPVGSHATVGIYYWKKGSDYVKYAKQMITKDVRVQGEFYVCPVYNEAIADGKKILVFNCDRMWGIGTPSDLAHFQANYKGPL